MTDADRVAQEAQVRADFAEAEAANTRFTVTMAEFQSLSMQGAWPAAEDARSRALAWLEAGLDAFTRGCRRAVEGRS